MPKRKNRKKKSKKRLQIYGWREDGVYIAVECKDIPYYRQQIKETVDKKGEI